MEEVGQTLRETRERLGLTVDEVERATHIRAHHLQALERGELETFPSPVQARGFLHNYAEFLGLDSDALLMRYVDAMRSGRRRVPQDDGLESMRRRPSVSVRSGPRRWFSPDLLLTGGIALAVVVAIVWGAGRLMSSMREGNEEAVGAAEMASPTAEVSTVPPSGTEVPAVFSPAVPLSTPTATRLPFVVPAGMLALRLEAVTSAWVRVIVDGQTPEIHRAQAGDVFEYQGRQSIEVVAGDGGAFRVFFNGQDVGMLGGPEEVVIRIWTLQGPVSPTPTLTPTPTQTPTPTRTPRVTPTAKPGT